jgi:hypothetical protein
MKIRRESSFLSLSRDSHMHPTPGNSRVILKIYAFTGFHIQDVDDVILLSIYSQTPNDQFNCSIVKSPSTRLNVMINLDASDSRKKHS